MNIQEAVARLTPLAEQGNPLNLDEDFQALDTLLSGVTLFIAERVAIQNDRFVVTCVFCGHVYPPNTPTCNHDALREHVLVCPEHPIADLRRKYEDKVLAVELEKALNDKEFISGINEINNKMALRLGKERDAARKEVVELRAQLAEVERQRNDWHQTASNNLSDTVKLTTGFNQEISELTAEIERFKRGNLTDEEFHNLCHETDKPIDVLEFCAGCEIYQTKVFGKSPITDLRRMLTETLDELRETRLAYEELSQISAWWIDPGLVNGLACAALHLRKLVLNISPVPLSDLAAATCDVQFAVDAVKPTLSQMKAFAERLRLLKSVFAYNDKGEYFYAQITPDTYAEAFPDA